MHMKFNLPELGIEVEIGKFARQAHGAAWVKVGNNIVLSTVVAAPAGKSFAGFFPLTVEYRERLSAAGKIPGGYLKREGRLSDHEVLISRIIDRPIRPLFPTYYFDEVQLLSTVYSSDGAFPASILSLIGSSIALTISEIPFMGPIGGVQIGRINGEWKFNLSHEEIEKSDTSIIVAGTKNGISMVEGNCNDLSEAELIDILFLAHEKIKAQVDWQLEIQKAVGKQKLELSSEYDWDALQKRVDAFVAEDDMTSVFGETKKERSIAMDALRDKVVQNFVADFEAGTLTEEIVSHLFENRIKVLLSDVLAKKQVRMDGRKLDEVRPISVEIGLLPCVHGSSVFMRGETQALSSITLGTSQDAQKVDSLFGATQERSFMLHYNFPPFSVGEVRAIRGVGRREIGHGFLAESSFRNVLPSENSFPYTIRSVVDILECNGSSSMATVCATSMALMDAGVPISQMVGGIAMGLVKDSQSNYHVLTDILGTEDALGLMDFKVTGTEKGIMAFQLDIKDKVGLPRELLMKALEQARTARLHILKKMSETLAAPRAEISSLAPRISSFKVPQDKIGAIIGPSGKVIKEIIAKTKTQIDIEDDGTVKIFSKDEAAAKEAGNWIKTIVGDIEPGSSYDGIVRRVVDFGIFVELVPGKEGLVHISSIARDKQRDLERMYKINDIIKVKVIHFDKETGRIRLIAPELEK